MASEYKAKVFKSGNSMAVRLPKGSGLVEGDEVTLVAHADGGFTFWRVSDAAAILDSLYGTFSSGFMAAGRGDIEQADRDWSTPSRHEAA